MGFKLPEIPKIETGQRLKMKSRSALNESKANKLISDDYSILPYHPSLKTRWDSMVSKASNSCLIHYRDYMEYHSHRFNDNSLLIFQNNQLKAVFPLEGGNAELQSHRGLTFGGVLIDSKLSAQEINAIFAALMDHLRNAGVQNITLKDVPSFFWSSYRIPRSRSGQLKRKLGSSTVPHCKLEP